MSDTDRVKPESPAVPFDDRKFRLMQLTCFAMAKRLADGVYVGIAGSEQALHERFRGRLQIALDTVVRPYAHAADIRVGGRARMQRRYVCFQYRLAFKIVTRATQQLAAQPCYGDIRGWLPAHDAGDDSLPIGSPIRVIAPGSKPASQ